MVIIIAIKIICSIHYSGNSVFCCLAAQCHKKKGYKKRKETEGPFSDFDVLCIPELK